MGGEGTLLPFVHAGKFPVKGPAALGDPFKAGGGQNQPLFFQHMEVSQGVVCNPVHHLLEQIRIVVHGVHHVFHAHEMHHFLGGHAGQAVHGHPHREDIADGLFNGLALLLGGFQIHTVDALLELVVILFQILQNVLELMADTLMSLGIQRGFNLNLQAEQMEIGIVGQGEIVRRYPVIVKQLLVQEAAVQGSFHPPGKLALALQPLRDNFLGEGPHFQVHHGALTLKGVVLVPLLNPLLILFLVGQFQLLSGNFPQDGLVGLRDYILHDECPFCSEIRTMAAWNHGWLLLPLYTGKENKHCWFLLRNNKKLLGCSCAAAESMPQ